MSREVNALGRRIWLLLLAKGGWWAPREVATELGEDSGTVQFRMQALKKHTNSLAHRMVQKSPPRGEYAVMPTCTVPAGITMGEIALALETRDTPPAAKPAATQPPLDTSGWLSPAELDFARTMQ